MDCGSPVAHFQIFGGPLPDFWWPSSKFLMVHFQIFGGPLAFDINQNFPVFSCSAVWNCYHNKILIIGT